MGTFGPGQIEAPTTLMDKSKKFISIGALASPIRHDVPTFNIHDFGM
jgi:hypothetical protein